MVDNPTLGPRWFPRRHLFLDTDNLVEWDLGIYQHVCQAEKVPTTGLECGPPGSWDARVAAGWCTVLVEDGVFRLWGCCMPGIGSLEENADVWLIGYAESDDGIHWRKPDLGITGQKRWPGNNLLKLPGCVMSVVRPLPGAGFKYLAVTIQVAPPYPGVCDDGSVEFNGTGTYLFGSDDGLHWTQITRNPMVRHGDWACLHVDRLRNRYLLYHKVGSSHSLTSRRSMIVMESKDAIHWEGYEGYRQWHESFFTDDYDDLIATQRGFRIAEYYSHSIHQVDSLYLAAQNLFTVGLPLHHRIHQNPAGQSHIRLAFSHDGICWRHPRGRPAFIEGGPPGSPDCGFLTTGSNFLEHGDETRLYGIGSKVDHGRGITPDFKLDPTIPFEEQERLVSIFVARVKRDRFASVASTYQACFDVEAGPRQGEALTVNAVTRSDGWVRVAIAEQRSPFHLEPRKSDSLQGFSFDDCVPFKGDAVKAPVRFRRASVAQIPKDKALILRFEVSAAEVFGYEWTDKVG